MADSFHTPSVIAKESLMHAENDLVFGNLVHTDYSKEFAKVGDTVTIRRPVMFQGQEDNLDLSAYNEDIVEGSTTVQLNKTMSVKFDMSVLDKTLKIEQIGERYIRPAVLRLRDKVETEIAKMYNQAYWFTGTPGTVPSTFLELGGAGVLLTNAGVPQDNRYGVHDPQAALKLADGLKAVYVQDKARTAFQEARIGRYAKFDNYESVHPIRHTVGALGGTPLVNGAAQNTTYALSKDSWTQTLVTDGWSNSIANIVLAGDVFTLPNVYAVNPLTKLSTGQLQPFVIRADASSNGSGQVTLTISPPIITSGAYQTVTAAPADNAALTIKTGTAATSYPQSLMFHKNAIALVTRPLEVPSSGAGLKTSTQVGNKMSIAVTEWAEGNTLTHNVRLDILFGVKVIYPHGIARLTS